MIDILTLAIARGLAAAARAARAAADGLDAWHRELVAERAAAGLAAERAAARRCRPCPVPPPVPRVIVGRRPAAA